MNWKYSILFVTLLVIVTTITPFSRGELIPADRRVDWNPGIPGGIPSRTTVCATVSPGDSASEIESMINNDCSEREVVHFPAGTYPISSTINFQKGVVLRGDGPKKTIIQMTSSTPQHVIYVGKWESSLPQAPLTGGYTKDSTTLTFDTSDSDESRFTVGSYIVVAQSDGSNPDVVRGNCGYNQYSNNIDGDKLSFAQIVRIENRNGNQITISPGLYNTLESQYKPLIMRVKPSGSVVINAGIEDMKVERTVNCGHQGSIITFHGTAYSWIKNVETAKVCGRHIRLQLTYGAIVRDSYWHESWSYRSGGTSYGLAVMYYSSANLITNNIGMYLNMGGVQFETSGGGNVVSYNYFDGSWLDEGFPEWMLKSVGSHCAHPHMELIEGNQATMFQLDSTHGSASHFTVFRNHLDTDHTYPSNPPDYTLPDHPYDDSEMAGAVRLDLGFKTNIVGNVLGQEEEYPHSPYSDDQRYECANSGECGSYQGDRNMYIFRTNNDRVKSTTLRHANYDYATNSVKWCSEGSDEADCQGGDGDHNLPDSLYLTSKPSWWDDQGVGRPWPPIGPDLDPMHINIPAKDRFWGLTYEGQTCSISADCNDRECNTKACVSEECVYTPASGSCTDDGNECTSDVCSGGSCTHPPNAASCDDDNECTTGDQCSNGVCDGNEIADGLACPISAGYCCAGTCDSTTGNTGYNVNCRSGPQCNDQSWEYVASNEGVLCAGSECQTCSSGSCTDDNNACPSGEVCSSDTCVGCTDNFDCNDEVACTDDVCSSGTCSNTPNNARCSPPPGCDSASCTPTGCVYQPDGCSSSPTGLCNNLVLHYSLDGSTIQDLSGNGNDGTANGATYTSSGKFLGAYEFDDFGDDFIQIGTNGMSTNAGTISLWVNANTFSSGHNYIFGHTSPGSWTNTIQLYTEGTAGGLNLGLSGTHFLDTDIFDLNTGLWYHIALTWDGTSYEVYVNSVSRSSGIHNGLGSISSFADFGNTGRSDSRSQAMHGSIDDVAIWSRSLSVQEISTIYNSGPLSCQQQQTYHRADNNPQDCVISLNELFAFMNRWKVSIADVDMVEMMEAIELWKLGTGCF